MSKELNGEGLTGNEICEEETAPIFIKATRKRFDGEQNPPIGNNISENVDHIYSINMLQHVTNNNALLNSMLTKIDSFWRCTICGKTDPKQNSKTSLKRHIEGKHIGGVSHPCNKCEKTFRSMPQHRLHRTFVISLGPRDKTKM